MLIKEQMVGTYSTTANSSFCSWYLIAELSEVCGEGFEFEVARYQARRVEYRV